MKIQPAEILIANKVQREGEHGENCPPPLCPERNPGTVKRFRKGK